MPGDRSGATTTSASGNSGTGSLSVASAISRARALVDLAQKEPLTDDDVARAVHLVREILPHVSDCDGLPVMVEVLPEPQVESILAARERSHRAGLDLLSWAATVRARNVAVVV